MEFDRLFAESYDSVVRYFRRRNFSDQEARDLAQETFLKAFKGFDRFRGEATDKTWLFVIAVNVFRNEIRRRKAQRRDAVTVPLVPPGDGEERSLSLDRLAAASVPGRQFDEIFARDRLQRLKRLVPQLPPRMQQVFRLRMCQERSYQDIASLMQVSVQTVKSQIHQARRRLEAMLDEDPGGERGNER